MYSFLHILALVIVIVFNIWYAKKYNINRIKALIFTAIVWGLTYQFMLVLTWIENGFNNFGAQNIVRVFVYIPLVAYLPNKILKVSKYNKMLDYIAICPTLSHSVSHIACAFAGCCAGRIITIGTKVFRFPSQITESIVAFAIAVILFIYSKKKKYNTNGEVFPMMLIMFGFTRFILEFLRDNEKLILGMSSLALHAIFMALVGCVWIYIIKRKRSKFNKQAE